MFEDLSLSDGVYPCSFLLGSQPQGIFFSGNPVCVLFTEYQGLLVSIKMNTRWYHMFRPADQYIGQMVRVCEIFDLEYLQQGLDIWDLNPLKKSLGFKI